MATPITIRIPHQLGRVEARRRIETGFGKLTRQLPGNSGRCSERWDGDRLTFDAAVMGQTIAGAIDASIPRSRWRSSCPASACSRAASRPA
jgi:hypothetical protein